MFGKNLNNGSSETTNETEKNPQTGDNILVMLAGLILSGSALIYAGAKKLKRN